MDRIFNLFDTDNDGKIKFEEFARGIALLAKGTYAQKLKCTFPHEGAQRERERARAGEVKGRGADDDW